jgi:hypothetical protein
MTNQKFTNVLNKDDLLGKTTSKYKKWNISVTYPAVPILRAKTIPELGLVSVQLYNKLNYLYKG